MDNIEMKLDGDILTIKVDMSREIRESTSGKSMLVACTNGNIKVLDTGAIIGLTIYRKKG